MIGCQEPNPRENTIRREIRGNFGAGAKIGENSPVREMITRSKLVEQLRDYQIRSQNKCSALAIFSPKPHIASRADVAVAILWALLFSMLLVSSCMTFYFRYFHLSFIIICLVSLLLIRLRASRQAFSRKKERRLLLPLSM